MRFIQGISRSVFILTFSNFFMTLSTSIILTVSPLFMIHVLALNGTNFGLVEGIAECVAMIMRILPGLLSDIFLKRKLFITLGFSISLLSKIFLIFAGTYSTFFVSRTLERFGNGLQGSPRDALIADLTLPKYYGTAFGWSQSFKKLGATIGGLVAVILFWINPHIEYKLVFITAVIPAIFSLILLTLFVKDTPIKKELPISHTPKPSFYSMAIIQTLPNKFWWVILLTFLYSISHYKESFFFKQALEIGMDNANTSLITVVLCLVVFLFSYPLGIISDRIGRELTLIVGFICIIIANLLTVVTHSTLGIWAATSVWGIHWAIVEPTLIAMITDCVPEQSRGTAIGIFFGTLAAGVLLTNYVFGLLWDHFGNITAITFSSIFAFTCILYVFTPKISYKRKVVLS